MHELICRYAKIECQNEGCSVVHIRALTDRHRAECGHEKCTCLCPGCDERLPRKDMNAHVRAQHMQNAEEQLQLLWRQTAASESEQRLAAGAQTSWVFNWRADGWQPSRFRSETHVWGEAVSGWCEFQGAVDHSDKPFITLRIWRTENCRVHATFSILDKHDKILRQVVEIGTADAPQTVVFFMGDPFEVTAAEKAQSVRADGSFRLRAVVRLFLD